MFQETVDDVFYGQATDDGDYDDVETYGPDGEATVGVQAPAVMLLAWGIVVLSLAGLWVMGAGLFKGSNQS